MCPLIAIKAPLETNRYLSHIMQRVRMLKEQAKLLRDIADAPGVNLEVRESMHKLARDCEELANVLERSLQRS